MTAKPKTKLPIVVDATGMRRMIKKFQCPGCVRGCDLDCGAFKLADKLGGTEAFQCAGHVAGTMILGGGMVALGLPKGFNKVGALHYGSGAMTSNIRLWLDGAMPQWDDFNVPVWAMKEGKYTFVRTYSPRINTGWVDVIEDGPIVAKIVCRPDTRPIDVAKFHGEID